MPVRSSCRCRSVSLGRTAAEDIISPETGEVIIEPGEQLIEESHAELIAQAEIQELKHPFAPDL
jgi:hypothetical protein